MLIDGFDVQAMGYAGPALILDWNVPKATLGPVFGAALLGVLVGSLLFGIVADRIGRRPVLVWATAAVAIITLLTGQASSIEHLIALRFAGGIAMGCILPNAIALAGEHSAQRLRLALMMIVGCGFTAGAALGGLLSSWMVPTFGWRAVFYAGGAISLAVAVALALLLPESPHFQRGDLRQTRDAGVPVVALFQSGRASATLLLWAIDFLVLLNLYFLSNWLPTTLQAQGRSVSDAVLMGATLQIGGTIGTLALSWLGYRLPLTPVLTACFALAGGCIALVGQPALPDTLLFGLIFVAGFCIVGGQPAVIALAASCYPTAIRATGVGWVLGVGRVGAIVGPVAAGELIALDWSAQQLFSAAAVPAVISAVLMLTLRGSAVPAMVEALNSKR